MSRAKKIGVAAGGVVGVAIGFVVARRLRRKVEELVQEFDLATGASFEVRSEDGAVIEGIVTGGDGPTVVLSHGWTETRAGWAPVAARLVDEGFRVVLYDQRGHGKSTMGSGDPSVAMLGADLQAVLEQTDCQDAVVVGHSMGGMAVLALGIGHATVVTERVRAVVLVSTGAARIAGPPITRLSRKVVAHPRVDRLLHSRVGLLFVRPSAGKTIHRTHLIASRDTFTATPADVRLAWLLAMQAMDIRKELASISVPATVVVGTRDIVTPPYMARAIVANLPDAQLVRVSGGGHQLPYERPDLIASLIIEAAAAGRTGHTASRSDLEDAGLAASGPNDDVVVTEQASDQPLEEDLVGRYGGNGSSGA